MNYPSENIAPQFIGPEGVNRFNFFRGKQVRRFEFEGIIQVSPGIILPEEMRENSGQDKNRYNSHAYTSRSIGDQSAPGIDPERSVFSNCEISYTHFVR